MSDPLQIQDNKILYLQNLTNCTLHFTCKISQTALPAVVPMKVDWDNNTAG